MNESKIKTKKRKQIKRTFEKNVLTLKYMDSNFVYGLAGT